MQVKAGLHGTNGDSLRPLLIASRGVQGVFEGPKLSLSPPLAPKPSSWVLGHVCRGRYRIGERENSSLSGVGIEAWAPCKLLWGK